MTDMFHLDGLWRSRSIQGIESALARATKLARQEGASVLVRRDRDGIYIATAWPDGKIDLTPAGAIIA